MDYFAHHKSVVFNIKYESEKERTMEFSLKDYMIVTKVV